MSITELDLKHDDEYKSLIHAVINAAKVDYIKLAHPARRNKKYLIFDYQTAVEMFFNEEFKFENFVSYQEELPLTLKELLDIMLGSTSASIEKTQNHILDETIKYWWNKNFHDLKVPSKINIFGNVYFIHNASSLHIDQEKKKIYLNLKKQGADRDFIKACLTIILQKSEIVLENEESFNKLFKVFYLFLKINGAFQHY